MGEPDAWDPGSPRNRDRTRESWRQVRGLLMAWDLVGVAGVPEAAAGPKPRDRRLIRSECECAGLP